MDNISRDPDLEKEIDAYIKGKLTEGEARQLWVKLLHRPEYIELLETELAVKKILQRHSPKQRSDDSGAGGRAIRKGSNTFMLVLQRTWKWGVAAAAVLLLIISVDPFPEDTAGSLRELAPDEFSVADNLSSAPVARSDTHQQGRADSLLNIGYRAAISGDLDMAVAVYDKIIERYGDSPVAAEAYLNKGIIQYNDGSYRDAAISFGEALKKTGENRITEERLYWYLGNTWLNTGNREKARDAIQNARSMNGIYQKPAARLLQKLDREPENSGIQDLDPEKEESR